MNKQIKELAKQAGINSPDGFKLTVNHMATFRLEKFAELVAAHERNFIATKWENLYGYDKQGVAEFIRKRANTQEETT